MIPPPSAGNGSIKSLRLKFPKKAVYNRGGVYVVQILKQVCKQCEGQTPALALEPVRKATEELDAIFLQRHKGLVMTQRKNIVVIHADKKRTFGNRYTLERDPDGSRISVAVTGSDRLHDLFVDIDQSGNVLMSYKGRAEKALWRSKILEVQLAIIPSNEIASVYTYFRTYRKDHLKKTELESLRKMELKISRLLLSPESHVKTGDDRVRKITAKEFKKMFGARLLKVSAVADKRHIRDLKKINDSYLRLRPYIDGRQVSYDKGIKSGDLRYVSKKALLARILDQFHAGKMHLPRVVIVRVNAVVGNGLTAGQYISPGTIIGEYSGVIVKMAPKAINESIDNTYFAPYCPDAVPGSEMFVIDARKAGNPTRFINHSDENSNAAWVPVFDGEKFRLIIAATKPVLEGRQILLKYHASYWPSSRIPDLVLL